jgi:G3E family GTPase
MLTEPMIAQPAKTQIFLLAGFLGSGKTTLLNRVLSWETDLADTIVLVNEFGKIGIDGSLIKSKDKDVIEMTSGCICCSIKSKLIDTLSDIWNRYKPKKILLEATGVAEPDSVVEVLKDEFLRERLQFTKIVTVLDIRYWNGRDKFGPFFLNQVQQANLVLLNKIDLVPKDRVHAALTEMHAEIPGCPVVPTLHCEVDPGMFWKTADSQHLGNFYTILPRTAVCEQCGDAHFEGTACSSHDHADIKSDFSSKSMPRTITYDSFDFVSDTPLSEICFESFLKVLPWHLFRIKGPVRFPNHTLMLNYAAGQIDWQKWDNVGGTRLAFIGWEVDAEEMLHKLNKCLLR